MDRSLLFAEAVHVNLLRRIRLIRPEDRADAVKRVAIVVLITWLPLGLLALAGWTHDAPRGLGFFTDIAVQVRFLLVLPILVAADYIILPRLEGIVAYFLDAPLVPPSARPAFEHLVSSSRRLSSGPGPAIVLAALVYASVAGFYLYVPRGILPSWQRAGDSVELSIAGWWHLVVSLPVLLGMLYGWLWRYTLWVLFLWRLSRMGLVLMSAHPDRAAGLGFLALSPRIFSPLALAIGTLVAATLADQFLLAGLSPLGHEAVPLATAVILTLTFGLPPLVFAPTLIAARQRGIFVYGNLALRMGLIFEETWFREAHVTENNMLERPDFSAAADLYGVVANSYGMRLLLFEYASLATVAIAAIAPFAPLWLTAISFSALMGRIVHMLI